MRDILLFALLGLGSGALIAGIALAIVLTYRGSGIINLATGGVAMIAGYCVLVAEDGRVRDRVRHGVALAITFVVTLAVGTAIELIAFRPLRNAAPLAKLVSSLGVLLVAQASMLLASAPRRSHSRRSSAATRSRSSRSTCRWTASSSRGR